MSDIQLSLSLVVSFIYDISLRGIKEFSPLLRHLIKEKSKTALFLEGQRGLLSKIKYDFKNPDNLPVFWFHASSLGEYSVVRPIIEELRSQIKCLIVFTFFSPTGYEFLKVRHPLLDYVFYLPLDTRSNVKTFINIIQPSVVVFSVSEIWPNYLKILKEKSIPTFLISAKINSNSPFFKWYGKDFRKGLDAFTHIYTIDKNSQNLLQKIGFNRSSVVGNPLFDNAWSKSQEAYSDAIIEKFCTDNQIFIAGSIHDKKDLEMVCFLANKNPDVKFLFVPHTISEEHLNAIKFNLNGKALNYSECSKDQDFSNTQVLIIDFLGVLPYLYRFAQYAYVGGGFTPYLHSLVEAVVYGIPVAFGPKIERKITPEQLIFNGIGQIVHNSKELNNWFQQIKDKHSILKGIEKRSMNYIQENIGATKVITTDILKKSGLKS